jgi:hypothetical protein
MPGQDDFSYWDLFDIDWVKPGEDRIQLEGPPPVQGSPWPLVSGLIDSQTGQRPVDGEIQPLWPDGGQQDPRYRVGPHYYQPGEEGLELEDWGPDGGRAGKSPPFQLDPRYRVDANPALLPGDDRIELDSSFAAAKAKAGGSAPAPKQKPDGRAGKNPPLQLDPRYRIDATPAVPPGQDRIDLEPEQKEAPTSWAVPAYADSVPIDPSTLAPPPVDVEFGAVDVRQPVPDVQFGDISVNEAPAQPYGPPNNPAYGPPNSPVLGAPAAPPRVSQAKPVAPRPGATPAQQDATPQPWTAHPFGGGAGSGTFVPPPAQPGIAQPVQPGISGVGQPQLQNSGGIVGSGPIAGMPQGGPAQLGGIASLRPGQARTSGQARSQYLNQREAGLGAEYAAQNALQDAQEAEQGADVARHEKLYEETEKSLIQRAQDRQKAQKDAGVRLAAAEKAADDLANQEPNPGRLWSNMSTFGKAALGIGMLANALANSRTPGYVNSTTQLLTSMIKEDVEFQQQRLKNQRERAKDKIAGIKESRADALAEVDDTYTMTVTRLKSLDRVLEAKIKQAGNDPRRKAGFEMARAKLYDVYAEITQGELQALTRKEEQARAHAAALQRAKIEAASKAQETAQKAALELEKERIKANADVEKDYRYLSPDLGITVITNQKDEKGNPVTVPPEKARLHKDYIVEAGNSVAAANKVDTYLQRMEQLLASKDNLDALTREDGEYNQLVLLVGRALATDPSFNEGGRTADADVMHGINVFTGASFQKSLLEGTVNIDNRMDQAKAAVKQYRRMMPEIVNQKLKSYPVPGGGSLHWTPPKQKGEVPNDAKYQVPGESEYLQRLSQDTKAGIPLEESASPALEAGGFKQPKVPQYTAPTRLKPLTPEQISKAEALDAEAGTLTTRKYLEKAKALIPEKEARLRVMRANEATIDKMRAKEAKVAEELVDTMKDAARSSFWSGKKFQAEKLEPDTETVKRKMRAAGYNTSSLTPKDIQDMKDAALNLYKQGGKFR